MRCFKCGSENPATTLFCHMCGSRLDLTADEIAQSLYEQAEYEAISGTEKTTRGILTFAIVLFIISVTMYISIGKPNKRCYLPSATMATNYAKVESQPLSIEKLLIPLEEKQK